MLTQPEHVIKPGNSHWYNSMNRTTDLTLILPVFLLTSIFYSMNQFGILHRTELSQFLNPFNMCQSLSLSSSFTWPQLLKSNSRYFVKYPSSGVCRMLSHCKIQVVHFWQDFSQVALRPSRYILSRGAWCWWVSFLARLPAVAWFRRSLLGFSSVTIFPSVTDK